MESCCTAGDEEFSYTWSPGADTSAIDEGEVAGGGQEQEEVENGQDQPESVDGADSTDGNTHLVNRNNDDVCIV